VDILHRWEIIAVSDHQSRVLAHILLRYNSVITLQLKLCAMHQWIFQPLLQLLAQPVINFHDNFFTWTIRGLDLEAE
jgi:hypothetical protein